jgi:hypothetical protein
LRRRFSNLAAIVLSFFSRDLYVDIARNWLGAGIVYLLLVSLLSILPPLIEMQSGVARFARKEAAPILEQIPPVLVHGGRVSSPVAMPYTIRDKHGRAMAILDTTGQVTSLDSTEAQVLVTATRVSIRKSAAETRVFELGRITHFELDRDKAARWLERIVTWLAPALSPFVFAAVFVFRLCQVLLFAGLGQLLAGPLKARLGFAALMRLAAVAFTPTFALDALRGAAGLHVPLWWLLSLVIAFVYLVFAIQANRESEPASQEAAPPPA